jgi:hypothetical protein
VRPEKVRIEANRCNPAREKPILLPGGHAAAVITTANEQKFARFLAGDFDVIIDDLPRLLRQLKPDGPTGFFCDRRTGMATLGRLCAGRAPLVGGYGRRALQ